MLDIKFKSNLESLEIGKTVINLQRNSSLFSAKISNQTISYNFTVAATKNNLRNLKIPHIIESLDNFSVFEVLILINNSVELNGQLFIESASKDYITLSIKSEDLNVDFLKNKLSSFNLGADISLGTTTADVLNYVKITNTKSYPATSHVFPMVYAPDFYGTENPNFLGVVNNYDAVAGVVIANTDAPVDNKNTIVPYFFLVYILKKIFETQNITLKGNFVDDINIKKLLVHNNFALDQFNIQQSFVRASLTSNFNLNLPYNYYQMVFQDDSTFPNEDTASLYSTTLGEFTIPHEGVLSYKIFNLTAKNFGDYGIPGADLQFLRFRLYLDGILHGQFNDGLKKNETRTWPQITISGWTTQTSSGYYTDPNSIINIYSGDVGKKVVVRAMILGTATAPTPAVIIYSGATVEISVEKWTDYNILSKTITPANHLPNITADSFINSFINAFKLMPYYDKFSRELFLSFYDDITNDLSYDDISANISSEKIKKLDNTGFAINYNFNGDAYLPTSPADTSKFKSIGEFNTVDDLPTPASVSLLAYVQSVNAYYVSLVTIGITWVRYKEYFDDFIIGDGSTPYKIDFAPFIMDNLSIDNDGAGTMRTFLLPKIKETGSSFFYKTGINDPLFKIVLWLGMTDGPVNGQQYPTASSYDISQQGITYTSLSFKLSSNYSSIYTKFLKNYFTFLLATKKVEHIYTSDLKNVLTYDFLEKKLIVNQRYLTGKLKLKITKNGFENIVAENYKV